MIDLGESVVVYPDVEERGSFAFVIGGTLFTREFLDAVFVIYKVSSD